MLGNKDIILGDFHLKEKCDHLIPAKVWMAVSTQNSKVEVLVHKKILFGNWTFGKVIRSWEQSLMTRMTCLCKRDPRELPCLFHHVRTQQVGTIYEQGNRLSPDTRFAAVLFLDFSLQNWRNKSLLFKSHPSVFLL
jgi:hypothetical protein